MTQQIDALEVHRSNWASWFSEVDATQRDMHFERWNKLSIKHGVLQSMIANPSLPLSSTNRALEGAANNLKYDRPYQVVVLGESGAGKSTLINALIGRNILVTGSGGAVTGVATYIYPNHVKSEDLESVKVTYRSEDEFRELFHSIFKKYHSHTTNSIEELQLSNLQGITIEPEAEKTLRDIQRTWDILRSDNRLATFEEYHPIDDANTLKGIMDENSVRNEEGSPTRLIAGISKIEYFLSTVRASRKASKVYNVVFVDTPGLGARTIRHKEILQEEIEKADAVILVVSANRPEQKTDEMANLLSNVLFENYEREQKDRFASKVFLVVNKYDAIKNDDDKRRLGISVRAICELISPNYWTSYGRASNDRRYFELTAQESNTVKDFWDKLRDFLSLRRLDLMLEEADTQLSIVVEQIRTICNSILKESGVAYSRVLSADAARTNFINQLCRKRLDEDFEFLNKIFDQMFSEFYAWRDSPQRGEQLIEIVSTIRRNLENCISMKLEELLNSNEIRKEITDPVSGQPVKGVLENFLLIILEGELRRKIESELDSFAEHYVTAFKQHLERHRIYQMIQTKSYGQSYIRDQLAPETELHREEARICDNHFSTCRQVLIYELIQAPIIESLGRWSSKVWDVIELPEVVGEEDLDSLKPQDEGPIRAPEKEQGGLTVMQKIFLPFDFRRQSSSRQDEQEIVRESDIQFADMLRKAINNDDNVLIESLLNSEFGRRIRTALRKAIPHLEGVFFYELDKFRTLYKGITSDIRSYHLLHVNDTTMSIQRILTEQHDQTLAKVNEATKMLAQVAQLN